MKLKNPPPHPTSSYAWLILNYTRTRTHGRRFIISRIKRDRLACPSLCTTPLRRYREGRKESYLLSVAKNRRIDSLDRSSAINRRIARGYNLLREMTLGRRAGNLIITKLRIKLLWIIYRSTIIIMENGRTLYLKSGYTCCNYSSNFNE